MCATNTSGTIKTPQGSKSCMIKTVKAPHSQAFIMTTASYTVYVKGQEIQFQSDLTSEKVYEILSTLTSSFAQDLARKFVKLSDKQYAWAVKLSQDHLNRQKELAEQNYDFNGILDSIEAAQSSGLKRIKLRFWDVMIKPSKYAGKMYVLSATEKQQGAYGLQPKYLGWITRTATSLRDSELIAMLENVAEDPAKAAKLHGMETGACCCCGRELTNRTSISLGIGPICAEKYGWLA